MCDPVQGKGEPHRGSSSRPVWTAALVTFVIMGVSKDSDHVTKIEGSRVKEMSVIQGQNEAVAQECSEKER